MPVLNIAGFWRRATAFVLDMLLLGIVGWILGALFFDAFAKLGSYGRAIGFVITMMYFVPLDSRLGHGQTLGKRILGLQVVDGQRQCLSASRSLLRYAVIGVPFFLNGFFIPDKWGMGVALTYIVGSVLSLIVLGGLLSLTYLYIFNRRTRQSLHDLAAGSYVVRVKSTQSARPLQPFWRGHVIAIGIIALLSIAIPSIVAIKAHNMLSKEEFANLKDILQQLNALPKVRSAQVSFTSNTINGHEMHYVSVVLWSIAANGNDKSLAEKAAYIAAIYDAKLAKDDDVFVQLIYGYDIGIASAGRIQSYQFKSGELQAP
jgi:uncharacterized RDD family membrane protein YckC